MILKTSPFAIEEKNTKDLDNTSREYPTLDDLMTEQKIVSKRSKTVHRRRDLDSLGWSKSIKLIYNLVNKF